MIGFILASTTIGTALYERLWGDNLIIILYLGPETIMPLASIIATIVGVLLVFRRFISSAIKKMVRTLRRQPQESSTESEFDQMVQYGDQESEDQ